MRQHRTRTATGLISAAVIALAIMFPSAIRLRCLNEIGRDAMSEAQVAVVFGIPPDYIPGLVSERWEPFIKMLKAL